MIIKLRDSYSSSPVIGTGGRHLCQTVVSLLERCPLVRGSITCIDCTCCKEFVSFTGGCPLYRECPLREGPLYNCILPVTDPESSRPSSYDPWGETAYWSYWIRWLVLPITAVSTNWAVINLGLHVLYTQLFIHIRQRQAFTCCVACACTGN